MLLRLFLRLLLARCNNDSTAFNEIFIISATCFWGRDSTCVRIKTVFWFSGRPSIALNRYLAFSLFSNITPGCTKSGACTLVSPDSFWNSCTKKPDLFFLLLLRTWSRHLLTVIRYIQVLIVEVSLKAAILL